MSIENKQFIQAKRTIRTGKSFIKLAVSISKHENTPKPLKGSFGVLLIPSFLEDYRRGPLSGLVPIYSSLQSS